MTAWSSCPSGSFLIKRVSAGSLAVTLSSGNLSSGLLFSDHPGSRTQYSADQASGKAGTKLLLPGQASLLGRHPCWKEIQAGHRSLLGRDPCWRGSDRMNLSRKPRMQHNMNLNGTRFGVQ